VTNCPYGKIVTDTIAITTTYCPGNPTITPTPTPYSQKAVEAYTTVVVTSYVDYCPGNGQLTTILYSQTQVLTASPTYEAAIPMYTTTKTWTSAGETVCATLTIPSGAPVPTPETPATLMAIPTSAVTSSLPVVKMVTETVKAVPYTPSSNYTVAAASGSAAPLSYSASPYAASPYSASAYSVSPYPTTSPVAFKGAASGLQAGSGLAMVMVIAAAALFL
jgi:chitinase